MDLNMCCFIFVLYLLAYKINIHIKIFILITTAVNLLTVFLFVISTRVTGDYTLVFTIQNKHHVLENIYVKFYQQNEPWPATL